MVLDPTSAGVAVVGLFIVSSSIDLIGHSILYFAFHYSKVSAMADMF